MDRTRKRDGRTDVRPILNIGPVYKGPLIRCQVSESESFYATYRGPWLLVKKWPLVYLQTTKKAAKSISVAQTDGRTDGRTVRILYASQSSFGGIKSQSPTRLVLKHYYPGKMLFANVEFFGAGCLRFGLAIYLYSYFTLCVCMSSGQIFGLSLILLSNLVYGMKNSVHPDQLASQEAS